MPDPDDQPIVAGQTTAQNDAVETVLGRVKQGEIFASPYQRDTDECDAEKKSLFIESVLNQLTVPAFYLAPSDAEIFAGGWAATWWTSVCSGVLKTRGYFPD